MAKRKSVISNSEVRTPTKKIKIVSSEDSEVPQDTLDLQKNQIQYDHYFEFKKDAKGMKIAECKVCNSNNEKRIYRMSNSSTSGIRRHILKEHREVLHSEAGDENTYQNQDIDENLVEWLCQKMLPFSFFDDNSTQRLFKNLNRNVNYPKRTEMRKNVIEHYNTMRSAVSACLKDLSCKVSLTVDGWTAVNKKCYYGVTIHFITNDWVLQSIPLDFIPAKGKHCGKDIAELVYSILKQNNLENRVQGITVDNAAVNAKFLAELSNILKKKDKISFDAKDQHFRCYAHILHLGVRDIMSVLCPNKTAGSPANIATNDSSSSNVTSDSFQSSISTETSSQSTVRECEDEYESDFDDSDEESEDPAVLSLKSVNPIDKIRRLFRKINKSEQWYTRLEASGASVNVQTKQPTLDVATRWNSTYDMMGTALGMEDAIRHLIDSFFELNELRLSDEDWELVKRIHKVLKPFKDVTKLLESERYPTLPLVVVSFNLLLDYLENKIKSLNEISSLDDEDRLIITALETGRNKLLKHYQLSSWVYGAVLILDPRHKEAKFEESVWGRELKNLSCETFKNIYNNFSTQPAVISSQPSSSTLSNDDEFDIYGLYNSNRSSYDSSSDELQKYLSENLADPRTNVLRYWSENSTRFPTLSKLARDFLCIPATSVPAERLFSVAGNVMRKARNRLNSDSARAQICVKEWVESSFIRHIRQKMFDQKKEEAKRTVSEV